MNIGSGCTCMHKLDVINLENLIEFWSESQDMIETFWIVKKVKIKVEIIHRFKPASEG